MKKSNQFFLLFFAVLVFTAGCSKDEGHSDPVNKEGEQTPKVASFEECDVIPGKLIVKLTPEAADRIMVTRSSAGIVATGINSIDEITFKINAVNMTPLFDVGGEFEKRQREAGLHLWYSVDFDENIMVTRAAPQFGEVDEIAYVEPSYPIYRIPYEVVPQTASEDMSRSAVTPPFNDPRLPEQWHYYNDGSIEGYKKGADINAYSAWGVEKGKPEVIVAVIDGGVDATHEDLAKNMWKDPQGRSGYNFYKDTYTIDADTHGTHVAGTVAAVNNNGKGVSGVAGGDGTANSGARIMTCQIFSNNSDHSASDENTGKAFQYAADNGAVIAQNSWGGGRSSQHIIDGIDYFIKYAGMKDDEQVGPMAGGLVLFAAGNSNSSRQDFPSYLEQVMSVAAMGPAFAKATYSNYGTTVDVTAPGGDQYVYHTEGGVLSCNVNNDYVWLHGTSMACPHVSGIAALIVSKYGVGQKGLTPKRVREIIEEGTRDIYAYNQAYVGGLGTGYVDAYLALMLNDLKAPDAVTESTANWGRTSMEFNCTVPADEDNGQPEFIEVYFSQRTLDGVNFSNPPSRVTKIEIPVGSKNAGEEVTGILDGLKQITQYYLAVSAFDKDRNRSEMTYFEGRTSPIEVRGIPSKVTVKDHETKTLTLSVSGDSSSWSFTVEPGSDAATLEKKNEETLTFHLDGSKAEPGDYSMTFKITAANSSASFEIKYEIIGNNAPKPTDLTFDSIYEFDSLSDEGHTFDLTEYFTDPDPKDKLTFRAEADRPQILYSPMITGNILTVKPVGYGEANVTIIASDGNKEASASFKTRLASPVTEVKLYPNPMTDVLNIMVESGATTSTKVEIYNSIGSRVISTTVQASSSTAGTVNVSKLSSGYYKVVVSYTGDNGKKEYTRTVMKR